MKITPAELVAFQLALRAVLRVRTACPVCRGRGLGIGIVVVDSDGTVTHPTQAAGCPACGRVERTLTFEVVDDREADVLGDTRE